MLRNERQIALNEVYVACQEVADGYEAATEHTHDAALAVVFRELAEERRRSSVALEKEIRATGDLPKAADPDAETAREFILNLKTAVAADHRRVLVEGCADAEAELEESAVEALNHDLSEDQEAIVRAVLNEAREARKRLSSLLETGS